MDQIIDKLSEIEIAAAKILEDAANQKKQLEKRQEDRIAAYDRDLETSTAKKVEKLQSQLAAQLNGELEKLKSGTEATLAALDQYYAGNHDTLSTEIYEKIIRK